MTCITHTDSNSNYYPEDTYKNYEKIPPPANESLSNLVDLSVPPTVTSETIDNILHGASRILDEPISIAGAFGSFLAQSFRDGDYLTGAGRVISAIIAATIVGTVALRLRSLNKLIPARQIFRGEVLRRKKIEDVTLNTLKIFDPSNTNEQMALKYSIAECRKLAKGRTDDITYLTESVLHRRALGHVHDETATALIRISKACDLREKNNFHTALHNFLVPRNSNFKLLKTLIKDTKTIDEAAAIIAKKNPSDEIKNLFSEIKFIASPNYLNFYIRRGEAPKIYSDSPPSISSVIEKYEKGLKKLTNILTNL